MAKTVWGSLLLNDAEGEALGLLHALIWVKEQHINNVTFELDSKRIIGTMYLIKELSLENAEVHSHHFLQIRR